MSEQRTSWSASKMTDQTPSRISQRLSLKRKLEGPDATSPIKRLRRKYGQDSISSPASNKSGKTPPRAKKTKSVAPNDSLPKSKQQKTTTTLPKVDTPSPQKYPRRSQPVPKIQDPKKTLTVKLTLPTIRLVDCKKSSIITASAKSDVFQKQKAKILTRPSGKSSRKKKSTEEHLSEETRIDEQGNEHEETLSYKIEDKFLVEAFESVTADDRDDTELFSLAGAVIAPSLADELNNGDSEWMKKASSECQVRWNTLPDHQPFVVLGTMDQVKQAQGYLQQLLEEIRAKPPEPPLPDPDPDPELSIEPQKDLPSQDSVDDAAESEPKTASKNKASQKTRMANKKTKSAKKSAKDLVSCDQCRGKFVSEEALQRHKVHHRVVQPSADLLDESSQALGAQAEGLLTSNLESTDLSQFYEKVDSLGIKLEPTDDSKDEDSTVAQCGQCEWQGPPSKYCYHISTVHDPSKYKCEICHEIFIQETRYRSHFACHFDNEGNMVKKIVQKRKGNKKTKTDETPSTDGGASTVADHLESYNTQTETNAQNDAEMVFEAVFNSVEPSQEEVKNLKQETDTETLQARESGDVTLSIIPEQTQETQDVGLAAVDPSEAEGMIDTPQAFTGEEDESEMQEEPPLTEDGMALSAETSQEVVECEVCGYLCVPRLMAVHKQEAHGQKKYACTLCNRKHSMLKDFEFHYAQHFSRSGTLKGSFLLKEITEAEKELLERCWEEKPKEIPEHVLASAEIKALSQSDSPQKKSFGQFKCKFCNFQAKTESAIKVHVKRHLNSNQASLSCTICSRGFGTEGGLKKHMAKVHKIFSSTEAPEVIDLWEKYMVEIDPFDPESWDALRVDENEVNLADMSEDPSSVKTEGNEEKTEEQEGGQEVEQEHSEGLAHTCKLCGYKGSQHAIYKHTLRHHSDKKSSCEYCPKSFAMALDLKAHLKHVHMDKEGNLRPETVVNEDDKELLDPKKKYMCRLCGFRSVMQSVKMHMARKHKPGGYKCTKCGHASANKGDHRRHLNTHMSTDQVEKKIKGRRRFLLDRRWMCHLCPYTTKHSETDLKEHISRKHEAPKHKCEYCGKMFGVIYDLNDHVNHMHLRSKRVICDLCGMELHQKNLKTHIQRVHENLRPHKCEICQRSFGEKRFLIKHQLRHQPKEMRQSTVYCKICNKAYVSEKNLKDHMNKHRGIKPYECNLCDAKFGIKTMWQRHLKNHERGMLKCPIPGCSRQAENESALNQHMVKKHKETAQFRCATCGLLFAVHSALKRHRCVAPVETPISPQFGSVLIRKQDTQQQPAEGVRQVIMTNVEISQDGLVFDQPMYIKQEGEDSANQQIVEVQNQSSVILTEDGQVLSAATAEEEEEGERDDEADANIEQEGGEKEEQEEEEETKIYMCSICQEIFSSMEAIEQHIVGHTGGAVMPESEQTTHELQAAAAPVAMVTEEGGVVATQAGGQTLLVEGENQAIYAITTSGGLETIQGMDIETANTLADLSGLLTQ